LAEPVFNPLPVTPSNKGDVGDNTEKNQGNDDPLLIVEEV